MLDLRNYAVVTAAYWGFTLTDGALRILVLLHFHALAKIMVSGLKRVCVSKRDAMSAKMNCKNFAKV